MDIESVRVSTVVVLLLGFLIGSDVFGAELELLSQSKAKTGQPDQIEFRQESDSGLVVSVSGNSKGNPGVGLRPEEGEAWNLSAFSRVEATVSNPGNVPIPVSLRVDNPGHWRDAPWNTETIRLSPGERRTLVVFFDHSYGFRPGFDLDPAQVVQLLLFTEGAELPRSFVVESVSAAGRVGESPDEWQRAKLVVPPAGWLLGEKARESSPEQIAVASGAVALLSESGMSLRIRFDASEQVVRWQPSDGAVWDLSDESQVSIALRNTGATPIQPAVRLESSGGRTAIAFPTEPVSPGEEGRISLPFASPTPWISGNDASENPFVSREVRAVAFLSGEIPEPAEFEVLGIVAHSPTVVLPDNLESGPPVPGDWELTLNEEFDGETLNDGLWNVHTRNYWDKRSHFSRDNVLVADGVARLRFERKTGHHNDDPGEAQTDYATGFLDTFGKWTQRYGYFEARMKLPEAPGLWPAFWTMPDRGPVDGERWKREQTTNGGMEFDIMEHLTRWGPHRYNVAFHWDGYGKGHRSSGTSGIYVGHDAEGFLTAGLLWLPGEAIYYCNGREVGRWKSERVCNVPSLLRFTHVSGGWDNDPIEDAKLPSDFVIDYVRCWQRRDLVD